MGLHNDTRGWILATLSGVGELADTKKLFRSDVDVSPQHAL